MILARLAVPVIAQQTQGGRGMMADLPAPIANTRGVDPIRLIDVLFLEPDGSKVAAAFEVEHSISIHCGSLRMPDLALSVGDLHATIGMVLAAPDSREVDVRAQPRHPAFSRIAYLEISDLPYSELERNRAALVRFGSGLKAVREISRRLI